MSEPRSEILARRARFLAVALAAGSSACSENVSPCLSPLQCGETDEQPVDTVVVSRLVCTGEEARVAIHRRCRTDQREITNVSCTSSDPSILTCRQGDAGSVVRGISPGAATITATTDAGIAPTQVISVVVCDAGTGDAGDSN